MNIQTPVKRFDLLYEEIKAEIEQSKTQDIYA
jgi:hypothetical protein